MAIELKCKVITLTPKRAETFLKDNHCDNRNLSEAHYRQLAHTISVGRWRLNGESIKFENGHMVDGQHRCRAVIEAGKAIRTLVVSDLQDDSFETIDQGKKRTAADFIRSPHSTLIAAASRKAYAVLRLEQDGKEYQGRNLGIQDRPDNSELVAFARANPEIGASAENVGRVWKHISRLMTPSEAVFAHWWLSRIDLEDADRFFESLDSGEGLKRSDPVHLLRERLMAYRHRSGAREPMNPRTRLALTVKAWNAFRANEPMTDRKLRWRSSGDAAEDFPIPV